MHENRKCRFTVNIVWKLLYAVSTTDILSEGTGFHSIFIGIVFEIAVLISNCCRITKCLANQNQPNFQWTKRSPVLR